jgi:hypothetical protein
MERTMRRTMETGKNPAAFLRAVMIAERQTTTLRASCCHTDRGCSQNWNEPGRNSLTLIYAIAQIENARKDEIAG